MTNALLPVIRGGSREDALEALDTFMNVNFHQGQHFEETPDIVEPLVELLGSETKVRAELLRYLGSMVPTLEPDELLPDSDGWMTDENDAAERSVAAIRAARPQLEHALNDVAVDVRCAAAWALARLMPASEAALRARFAIEPDEHVRVTLLIALGTGLDDSDVSKVLRAKSPLDDASADAFRRLLALPRTPWLLFEQQHLSRFAGRRLALLGREEPRSFELVRDAVLLHRARVEAGPIEREWSDIFHLVTETDEDYAAGRAVEGRGETLRQLETLLGWLVLGERCEGEPLRRDELDARAISVLPLLWSSLENPPRKTAESFLREAPLEGFELTVAQLAGEFPTIDYDAQKELRKRAEPSVTAEQASACIKTLKGPLDQQTELAMLLTAPWRLTNTVPPEEVDVVIEPLMWDVPNFIDWFALFPSKRRAALAVHTTAAMRSWYPHLLDEAEVSRAIWARFLSPDCPWDDHEARDELKFVDPELIRSTVVTGSRRRVLDAMAAPTKFVVTLMDAGEDVLVGVDGDAPVKVRDFTAETLRPLVEPLRVDGPRQVRLEGDVSAAREYEVFLLLGTLLRPVTVIDRNGTELVSG